MEQSIKTVTCPKENYLIKSYDSSLYRTHIITNFFVIGSKSAFAFPTVAE